MKNIVSGLSILFVLFASCTKDSVDYKPKSVVEQRSVWHDPFGNDNSFDSARIYTDSTNVQPLVTGNEDWYEITFIKGGKRTITIVNESNAIIWGAIHQKDIFDVKLRFQAGLFTTGRVFSFLAKKTYRIQLRQFDANYNGGNIQLIVK